VSSTAISFETLVFDSISLHPLGYGQASDAGNAINIRTSPKRSIPFGLERPLSSNNEGIDLSGAATCLSASARDVDLNVR
jgi:hypothetical protein